jgi:chorismate synthase
MVFAGAVCRQVLERRGITIAANVVRVGGATGKELNFEMKREILDARAAGDSVGSVLECVAEGIPAGVGGLMFGGMESRIAQILYAIPGVKGVEFGLGFGLAELRGSAANDPFRLVDGKVVCATNNAGGINGGITNGMPLVVRMAMRPTPSIALEQHTVDLSTMQETKLRVSDRHDPCLATRAIPVMEAAVAIAVLDAMLESAALENV